MLRRYSKVLIIATILALAGLIAMRLSLQSAFASNGWYVAPSGSDANDCLSSGAPCNTINAAIDKASAGDTVYVASGVYTNSTGGEVVLVSKSITLTGGWGTAFAVQDGVSIVDGEQARRGVTVNSGVTASLEHFTIQHGYHPVNDNEAGGLQNQGDLTLSNVSVIDNRSFSEKGGVVNAGNLTLTDSRVTGNNAGIYNLAGSLIVNNSFVGQNSSGGGLVGGIYNFSGAVVLNNSTVSRNECGYSGCGIYNYYGGSVNLNNATVTENKGGIAGTGLANNLGTVTLRNSLVASNTLRFTEGDSDCAGAISSAGYNTIGTTAGCGFAATATDQVNLSVHGLLLGGNYALFAASPAVDQGNPTGCQNHQGQMLTTDQRGAPRPLDGDGDGTPICDVGAYEFNPADPIRQVFLPVVARNFTNCPDFFDDFSNPASGWPVRDDGYVHAHYLNGEYRVYSRSSGYSYVFRAPTCNRQNYVVEVDARWQGTPGSFYGLILGVTPDFSQYYMFIVHTDYGGFSVYRSSPSGLTYLNGGLVPGLNNGTTPNHLKVTRNADQISVEANGHPYMTLFDSTITGLTGVGVVSIPYNQTPKSDARFDNFRVTGLPITVGPIAPDQPDN